MFLSRGQSWISDNEICHYWYIVDKDAGKIFYRIDCPRAKWAERNFDIDDYERNFTGAMLPTRLFTYTRRGEKWLPVSENRGKFLDKIFRQLGIVHGLKDPNKDFIKYKKVDMFELFRNLLADQG